MAVLSEEQSMLRDAAKSWVQEKSPVTAFRKMRDSGAELGYDAAAWNEMAEMGWAGVIIPEEYGGSNFGYLSLGLILEELGRTLTASPLLASGLAAASALILGRPDAQKSESPPKLAETTLDYLKVRVQFGQVIGSFQALQHRAAKMFTDLELSRSAVEAALAAIDADSPDVPELVSLAKAKMGDTFHLVSNEMVQMHGGIGMTDAHDAGFYLKRARAAEAAFGNQ